MEPSHGSLHLNNTLLISLDMEFESCGATQWAGIECNVGNFIGSGAAMLKSSQYVSVLMM